MTDRKLYQQKKQAQLDKWKAEVDRLKARASEASADVKLEMNKHIAVLKSKIEENEKKLSELARSGDDAWESVKEGVESAWDSLKSAVGDAAAKFKK